MAPRDVVVGAVAHVQPEDVGAGDEQAADHLEGVGGRAERRDDLDVALAAERGHARPSHPVLSAPVIAERPVRWNRKCRAARRIAGAALARAAARPILRAVHKNGAVA